MNGMITGEIPPKPLKGVMKSHALLITPLGLRRLEKAAAIAGNNAKAEEGALHIRKIENEDSYSW